MGKRKRSEVNELSDGRKRVDEHTVYLCRLPKSVSSKQQVVEALQEFGQAVHVHIQDRGFEGDDLSHGFVHFSTPSAAQAAVRAGGVQILHHHVEIREAKPDKDWVTWGIEDGEDDSSKAESVLQEGEECFYWRGRLEKFRRGHGFLRPLPGGEQLPGSSVESTIQRGVYVSPAQVDRFDLADGDVVGAQVRPPRSQEQRFGGDFQGGADEQSWAILHVCDVNGEDSAQLKRRGWNWDDTETFEWTGMEDRRSVENPDVPEAEMGVFLSPSCITHHKLRDGDVVKALICKDGERKSMIVRKVLHLERSSQELQLQGWCFVLEGLVETFSERVGGYGFLRPADDSRELFESKGCAEGVFIYPAQIRRYRLRDGQRVVARIYPAEPPERSPKLVDILPDAEEEDDIWQLLEKNEELMGECLELTGYYGFLKADHKDIPEEVFFRVRRGVEPREGEAVFFRLEIRRRHEGEWTPCAVNIHYHQQGMEIPEESAELLKPAEPPQPQPEKSDETTKPEPKTSDDPKDSDEASKPEPQKPDEPVKSDEAKKSDEPLKSDEAKADEPLKQAEPKESAEPKEADEPPAAQPTEAAEAQGKPSNSASESLRPPEPAEPPKAQRSTQDAWSLLGDESKEKWWESPDPVKPTVQPSAAPVKPSEPPSKRRLVAPARKTYGKGDPDVVLSVDGNRFDRLKGKSKGDKSDKGGKGKGERKGDRDGKGKGKGEARGKGRDGRGKGGPQSSKSQQELHQQSRSEPPQHHRPSGSARPIFGQPRAPSPPPPTEFDRSKVHIHVHVNGQEIPRCPTPRGSIAQLLPQGPPPPPPPPEAPEPPSVRIRPTVAPKKLNEKKKRRKNRRNQNNFDSTYSMDHQMDQMEMEPEIEPPKSRLPGTSGSSGPWNPGASHPSRPKISPSQAPAASTSAASAPAKRKVTKVLQSRPKGMPRKRPEIPPDPPVSSKSSRVEKTPELPPVKMEDDFIMVRVDQSEAPRSSAATASDFVLVQVEVDEAKEPKQLPRPKVEVKEEDWDEDWDCCSLTSSDFRCGAWGHPHADRAIRVLADQDMPFYRLAVQQAETLYGVVAANPVFFKWSEDPEAEVATWFAQAMRNFSFDLTVAFMVSLLALSGAVYRFSWMAPALAMTDELSVSGKSYGTGQDAAGVRPCWAVLLSVKRDGKVVSMLPPLFLGVEPHHTVLDLCAAPGSKTFQMLEVMHWPQAEEGRPPTGFILANELQWRRANMLAHQVGRLGSPCMVVVNCDAQFFPEMSSGEACQQLGVEAAMARGARNLPLRSSAVRCALLWRWHPEENTVHLEILDST
eukprot:s3075_g4.t1